MNEMFKRVIVAFILLFLIGCDQDSSSPDNIHTVSNNELTFFGFAVIDCGWNDPNDSTDKTNYIDEISGFANVGQMCVYSPDDSLGNRIGTFNQAGVKAILHIESILFDHHQDVNTPSGVRATLRSDAETRWANFVNLNKDVLTPQNMAALYIVDEPVWNGVSLADFTRTLQIVKALMPDIPSMTIEAYPVVNQIMVPQELDWVGFDRYDTVDPEHDETWLADLKTVRAARTRSDQKIVIVASTQWLPYYQTEAGVRPEDMEAVAYSYYRLAASEPDVIALLGYLWPGGLDDPAQLGARNLPDNVQQSLREIGEEIIRKH